MSIGNVVEKYTTRLDAIIERETLTSVLNMNQDLIGEYYGGGKIEIPTLTMDGLGDYSRANGFPKGAIDLSWSPYQMQCDRGREFSIDKVDDEERAWIVSANLMAEFMRQKVVPEVDAIRFANMAENAGTVKAKTFSGSTAATDAVAAVEEAKVALEDLGAATSELVLFCTGTFKSLLRSAQNYMLAPGQDPNGNFTTYDEMRLVTVPQARFYSAIGTLDGTTVGETDGGYTKADDGADLNFILVHPKAVAALQKHEALRYFAPEVNQDKDAHKWQYRLYHDLLVFENKSNLIWASKKA